MKRSRLPLWTCVLVLAGACADRSESAERTGPENRDNTPPMNQPVLEADPEKVPTTDERQAPPTGPTAGTTPNVSPGRNDAPSPDLQTGGHKAAGGSPQVEQPPTTVPMRTSATTRRAEAEFKTAKGTELEGEAKLEEFAEGVRVTVKVEDAPPGLRGIHVHEKGDCSDIPGKSMGEHFRPEGKRHGLPGAQERHLGDLGNIQVAQDGTGTLDITVPRANLKEDDRLSLLGKALVIHQAEDKGTGKSGDSGKPIACAVIEAD